VNTAYFTAALSRLTNPDALMAYVASRQLALSTLFLANLLPPVNSSTDEIQASNVRIVTEPAVLTALDSPYGKVGDIQITDFREGTFKLTGEAKLNEQLQRSMHARANGLMLMNMNNTGVPAGQGVQAIYENFLAKFLDDGVSLAFDYGQEQYRALALAYGKISGKFGNVKLNIDFQVPADYQLARTGTAAYGGTASKWWDDVDYARERLAVEPECVTDPTTFNTILNNDVNKVFVRAKTRISSKLWKWELTRQSSVATSNGQTADARYNVTVWVYSGAVDKPGAPYFWPTGRVTFIRRTDRSVELINGSVVTGGLGVTHIGPNTELGMVPGRYLRVYTPEARAFEVIMNGTEFILPHLQEPRNVVLVATDVP
jgi:hypothetical protein